MLAFLRHNAIALLALVIALSGTSAYAITSVRSQDIVDGQVKTADLANGAVTPAKTRGLLLSTRISDQPTSDCYAGANQWAECAGVKMNLPAKGTTIIVVTSTVQVDPANSAVTAEFCPSTTGPTCIQSNDAEWATFFPGGVTSSTWAAQTSGSGTLTLWTGVRLNGPTLSDANVQTRVDVYSEGFETGK